MEEISSDDLIYAIENNDIQFIKKLINNDIDLNRSIYKNDYKYSVLSYACLKNKIDIVKILVECVNVDEDYLYNDKNKNALYYACTYNTSYELINLIINNSTNLINYDKNMNTDLILDIIFISYDDTQKITLIEMILNSGYTFNKNKNYIYEACYRSDDKTGKLVQYLIDKNANINARTETFQISALHYAVRNKYNNLIKLLINNNADINIKDLFGQKPFIYHNFTNKEITELVLPDKITDEEFIICYKNNNDDGKIILLNNYLPDINIVDSNGDNLLYYTRSEKIKDLLIWLGINN